MIEGRCRSLSAGAAVARQQFHHDDRHALHRHTRAVPVCGNMQATIGASGAFIVAVIIGSITTVAQGHAGSVGAAWGRTLLRATPLAALLLSGSLMAGNVQVNGGKGVSINAECDVSSDYDFHLTERSVVFTRKSGSPQTVLMREGRLFVDGQWVTVSAADSRLLRDYERDARLTMPLAQQIGRDAAQIAFTAIGEVAAGLSNNPAETRAKMAEARAKVDARLATAISANHFSGDELGKGIGDAVADVIPAVIGDVVGGAVSAAFSGDASRLQRMDNLDAQIEALIAPRAKTLERNANLLCRKMEALDGYDNALAYRLPDGRPLDLLVVKPASMSRDK